MLKSIDLNIGVYTVYFLHHLWIQTIVIFKNVIWEIFD